jgi:predicted permease
MSWIDGFRHRVRVWLRARAYAREQAEELRVHEEMRATNRPLPRGQEPNMQVPIMDALRQDLSYAVRGMRRSPGFTAMVVATLALGVGANGAMYSVLDGIFGVPAGLPDPKGLRRLYLASPENFNSEEGIRASVEFSYPSFAAMEEAVGDPDVLAAWAESDEAMITWEASSQPARISWITHDFFSVLGVRPALGRFFSADEARVEVPSRVLILSHDFWTKTLAADPAAVGRTVSLNDTTYTVIGVAGEGFRGAELSYSDIFLPVGTLPYAGQTYLRLSWYQWGGSHLRVVGRISDETEVAVTERATLGFRQQPVIQGFRNDTTNVVLAGPIVEALGPGRKDAAIPISTRTAGVTLVVLLVACANAASLLLVRATRRRREVAVRLALGVARGRLFAQLLAESVLLAVIAGGIACALAVWGGSVLRRLLLPNVQWAQPTIELGSVALVMVIALATGLIAGVAPSFHSLRQDTSSALRAGARDGVSRRSLARSSLLVAQAALSVVLVMGAALFVRSLGRLDSIEVGYDTDQIIRAGVRLTPRSSALLRENPGALAEVGTSLAGVPGVTGVALTAQLPMGGWASTSVYLPGQDLPIRPGPSFNEVAPEFFSVAGIGVLAGRSFEPGEHSVAIVNETMAATLWPGQNAVGQCLVLARASAECTEIIGVAENAHRSNIIEEPTPQYYLPLDASDARAVVVRFDEDWRHIVTAARAELERTFGPEGVRVERLSDGLAPQLRQWRLGAQLFTAFGVLALVVTAVGVYSVMAYTVSQRTHEMGVRIALGARIKDVMGLVVGQGLGVVVLGVGLGIVIALVLGKLIASLLYGVKPHDPVALAAAALVLITVGVVACLVPAWRAAQVDPVRALSAE